MRLLSFSIAVLLVSAVLSGPAQAQKIKVEFDKAVDFAAFKTYACGPDTLCDWPAHAGSCHQSRRE